MNLATDRLCVNEPEIASKIIDDEAILINLQTGAYYSLDNVGALVWHALRAHRTQSEILQTVAALYDSAPTDLQGDLAELLGDFENEKLVRRSERDRPVDSQEAATLSPRTSYSKPILEKFSDMEDLLALDPPTPGALDSLMRQPLGDSQD